MDADGIACVCFPEDVVGRHASRCNCFKIFQPLCCRGAYLTCCLLVQLGEAVVLPSGLSCKLRSFEATGMPPPPRHRNLGRSLCETRLVYQRYHLHLHLAHLKYVSPHGHSGGGIRVLLSVRPTPRGGGLGWWVWQNFRVGGCPTPPPPGVGWDFVGALGSIEPVPLLSFFWHCISCVHAPRR